MQKHKRVKVMEAVLGASGTIIVALFIILARMSLPSFEVWMAGEKPWVLFLIVSSVFFFPPYFGALGLFGLYNPETGKDEDETKGFMSSYAYTEKSKKDWIKHLVACVVGVLNASLMWLLLGTNE